MDLSGRVRVALLAGTLLQGGAEKQLVYLTRTLTGAGVDTRVYSLTRGEFYEGILRGYGLCPDWVGPVGHPALRLAVLTQRMRKFRPDIIQSTHAFTNLYAGVIGRLLNVISVGALRSSVAHARVDNGPWTRWLLRSTDGLFVNSQRALQEVQDLRLARPGSAYLVSNVIELSREPNSDSSRAGNGLGSSIRRRVTFVGRLIPAKRLDRFLRALALGRRQEPSLEGLVVGDGPCRGSGERLAADLGLAPDHVKFLGRRDDVPDLLKEADMLVLCSDQEGFPNVLLEAMAARLPVITTPAGDAGRVVEEGVTGYVVPFEDVEALAAHMVRLARSPEQCARLGTAGRFRVEQRYSLASLLGQVTTAYNDLARRRGQRKLLRALETVSDVTGACAMET
jgi:glycosyltransferase involved in cell wall biosynthesis